MATIAPPRSPVPRRGVAPFVVTPFKPYTYVKQTTFAMNKHSADHSNSSIRSHHVAISATPAFQHSSVNQDRLKQHSGVAAKQNQPLMPIPEKTMTSPFSSKQFLLSSPSTSSSFGPVTPVKHPRDKSLPPKPFLRSQDSPERRGVLDATDLTASALNGRYPPLEPTSSPESLGSTQQSPEDGSVKITPSLLSNDQSPASPVSFVEYGTAHSTSIQPFNKPPELNLDQLHDANLMTTLEQRDQMPFDNILRNGPVDRSALIAVEKSVPHHVGYQVIDSPSRSFQRSAPGSLDGKRSILRGNNISRHLKRGVSPMITSARDSKLQATRQEVAASKILPSTTVTCNNTSAMQNDVTDKVLRIGNNKRNSQRSSKYGYHIRESFDAHRIIMGKQGDAKVGKSPPGPNLEQPHSSRLSHNDSIRELKIHLTTPSPKNKASLRVKDRTSRSIEDEIPSSDENCNTTNEFPTLVHSETGKKSKLRASGIRPPFYASPHPPRTSSLQGTPPARSLKGIRVSYSASASKISTAKPTTSAVTGTSSVNGNSAKGSTSQRSPSSMLYRDTAASAARASLNGKKAASPRTSNSRLSHSHTLSSFKDVSKGMKKLGKKMGKIIPGLRTAPVSIDFKEKVDTESESNNSTAHLIPHRQASRLLTTYENSDMSKKTDDDLRICHGDTDDFGKVEPTDKHESEKVAQDKNTWNSVSYGFVRSSGAMHFFGQGTNRVDMPFSGSDSDEDPPVPGQDHGGMQGHYVEVEFMPSDEDLLDTERVSPLSTPTRTEYDFSEGNADQDPIHGAEEEACFQNSAISEFATNRSSVQNSVQDIHRNADGARNHALDASDNANHFYNPISHTPVTADSFQGLVSEMNGERVLNEADAKVRELLTWAMNLQDSTLRELVVTVCAGLAQSILQIRTARMSFIQAGLAADELICFIENSITRVESSLSSHRQ